MLQYSRNVLLSMRFWWKVPDQLGLQITHHVNYKQTQRPLSIQVFNSPKDLDILRRFRGQRGGRPTSNLRPKPSFYFTTLPSSSTLKSKVSTTTLYLHNLRSSSFNDKQTQRPLSPQVFNYLKDLDILRRSRGQRGGRSTNNLRPKPLPYFTTLSSSSNVTTATPHLHNLRSSSLNIQDCKKHVSKSFPRGNYNHHSSTRMLTNISATRQSHNFPTFFLSNTRSMVNKLDEINATIVNNKSDVAVITESWLSTNITDDLIMIPGFRSVRKDRPDNQRGGGLCTKITPFK